VKKFFARYAFCWEMGRTGAARTGSMYPARVSSGDCWRSWSLSFDDAEVWSKALKRPSHSHRALARWPRAVNNQNRFNGFSAGWWGNFFGLNHSVVLTPLFEKANR